MITSVMPQPTDQTDPQKPGLGPSLEQTLAEQANTAIAQGRDPKLVTDRLGIMVKHLRDNPDIAASGSAALARGADPGLVGARTWQLASNGSGNINLGASPLPPGVTMDGQPSADKQPAGPGYLSRLGTGLKETAQSFVQHPLDTAGQMLAAPVKSLMTAMAPGAEETDDAHINRAQLGVPVQMPTAQMQAADIALARAHAVTPRERAIGVAQTIGNIAAPDIGLAAAPVVGASYMPEDPLIGAALGTAVGALTHGAIKAGGAGLKATIPLYGENPLPAAFSDVAKESAGQVPLEESILNAKFAQALAAGAPAASKLASATIPKPEGYLPGETPTGVSPTETLADQMGPRQSINVAPKIAGTVPGLETSEPVEPPTRSKPLAGVESVADEAQRHAEYDQAVNDAAAEYDERQQEEQVRQAALRALTGVKRRPGGAVVPDALPDALAANERSTTVPASPESDESLPAGPSANFRSDGALPWECCWNIRDWRMRS